MWEDSNHKWHWDWDGSHSAASAHDYYIYNNNNFPGHGFSNMPRLLLVGGLLCMDHDNDADDLAQGDETGTHNKLIRKRIYIEGVEMWVARQGEEGHYDNIKGQSGDRKSTRLNSSHPTTSRMPSSA